MCVKILFRAGETSNHVPYSLTKVVVHDICDRGLLRRFHRSSSQGHYRKKKESLVSWTLILQFFIRRSLRLKVSWTFFKILSMLVRFLSLILWDKS